MTLDINVYNHDMIYVFGKQKQDGVMKPSQYNKWNLVACQDTLLYGVYTIIHTCRH